MDNILLIEDRDDVVRDLTNIMDESKREYRFLRFHDPREFVMWGQSILDTLTKERIKDASKQTPKSALSFGIQKEKYSLAIINATMIAPSQIPVLEKISQALVENEQLHGSFLPICFIAHEADDKFDLKNFDHAMISNILFKPFDKVVVLGKILWALDGVKARDRVEIYKEAPVNSIEMVKTIECRGFNGRGFTTFSEIEVPVKSVGYYYGFSFVGDKNNNGVFAICRTSKLEDPKLQPPKLTASKNLPSFKAQQRSPQKPYYRNFFEFLNLDLKQIRNLRLSLNQGLVDISSAIKNVKSISLAEMRLQIAIVHEKDVVARFYREQIEGIVEPVDVVTFNSLSEFMLSINPLSGAKEIVKTFNEYRGPKDEILMVWDETGTFFINFEKPPLSRNIYGLNFDLMSDFKKQILGLLKDDQHKKRFNNFWTSGNLTDQFVFETTFDQRTFYLTFDSREKVVVTGGTKMGVKICLRLSTDEEIISYLTSNTSIAKPVTVVLVSEKWADHQNIGFWQQMRKSLKINAHGVEPIICRIGVESIRGLQSKEFIERFDGFFTEVTDREYLGLVLSGWKSNLKIKSAELGDFQNKLENNIELLSAVEVKLKSVSEVNLSFLYGRDMGVNSIRYFRLTDPQSGNKVALAARCVDVEPDRDDKNSFLHHFVFYGTREQENFLIRRWMIEAYYNKKAKAANE